MKAISLWQPWAQWVILGPKKIETRLHDRFKSLVGQKIAIHASKKWDYEADAVASRYLNSFELLVPLIPNGGILGTCFIKDDGWLTDEHSHLALIDCGITKRYGLFISEPMRFDKPIDCRGYQGIFEVEL